VEKFYTAEQALHTTKVCHPFRYQIKYLYKIPLSKLCQVSRIMGARAGAVG